MNTTQSPWPDPEYRSGVIHYINFRNFQGHRINSKHISCSQIKQKSKKIYAKISYFSRGGGKCIYLIDFRRLNRPRNLSEIKTLTQSQLAREKLCYRDWSSRGDLLISNDFQDCTIPDPSTYLATLQGSRTTHLQFRFPKARHQTTICETKTACKYWMQY